MLNIYLHGKEYIDLGICDKGKYNEKLFCVLTYN